MTFERKNMWYARESRASNPFKILVYSDKGSMTVNREKLEFIGDEGELEIEQPIKISVERQTLNWGSYLILGAIFAFVDLVLGPGVAESFGTTWVLTKLYLVLAPLCILIFWYPVKWLVVHYHAEDEACKAYFCAGELNGFKALLGANSELGRNLVESKLAMPHLDK